jgi:hypothetical protein
MCPLPPAVPCMLSERNPLSFVLYPMLCFEISKPTSPYSSTPSYPLHISSCLLQPTTQLPTLVLFLDIVVQLQQIFGAREIGILVICRSSRRVGCLRPRGHKGESGVWVLYVHVSFTWACWRNVVHKLAEIRDLTGFRLAACMEWSGRSCLWSRRIKAAYERG